MLGCLCFGSCLARSTKAVVNFLTFQTLSLPDFRLKTGFRTTRRRVLIGQCHEFVVGTMTGSKEPVQQGV